MSDQLAKYRKVDHAVLKISYVAALCILGILLIWGGIKLYDFYRYEQTNDAQIEEYINPILSRTSGFVQEIRYTDHQQVAKGDTLVILDKNEATVRLHQVEAEIGSAEAQLKVLQNNIRVASSGSSIHKAQISAAEAQLWRQQKDYERYEELLKGEAVTQQQFEGIKTQLEIAKSNYEAVKNTFVNSQDQVSDAQAKLEVAQANLEQKKVELEKVKLDLQYAVILAPSNGFMGTKKLQEGQFIQAGQTVGYMVDKQQGKWVVANFQETQIADMHEGQQALITVDAFPGESFTGVIESFSPATGSQFSLLPSDNATGNFVKVTQRFPVKITFNGNNPVMSKLKAGMNAEVSIVKD
ncbi:HlyD family secretion protein [Mangrovibacterium diazotrophicum]|uniref:Membrane fusion protein (Multidrug efflux system) n=1 Tax=Mangrovibacterium diazotrophicum TaxID=1261403 RepID=A0A419W2V9_9BACT|nr:HlyD family secretion protein [Mangrovibacterium diazotrophicum]RKD89826.1 membrane fusion protein (multidrug efflux system) [Mangrovibacterium diazotrophicum]